MYMAVFSGGRWIRAQLDACAGAAPTFWPAGDGGGGGGGSDVAPGRAFLRFEESTRDGEDVKAAFRQRFEEVGGLLDERERGEVVREAGEVFAWTLRVVRCLDGLAAKKAEVGGEKGAPGGVLARLQRSGSGKERVWERGLDWRAALLALLLMAVLWRVLP